MSIFPAGRKRMNMISAIKKFLLSILPPPTDIHFHPANTKVYPASV